MAVKTYSPKQIGVLFGGIDLTGWVTITVSRANQLFTRVTSADGKEVARARNDDIGGTCEIEFQQFADSNAVLDAVRKKDEELGTGVATFKIVNKISGEEIFSSEAWVQTVPDVEYTNEIGTRTWILELAQVKYDITAQANGVLNVISNIGDFFEAVF